MATRLFAGAVRRLSLLERLSASSHASLSTVVARVSAPAGTASAMAVAPRTLSTVFRSLPRRSMSSGEIPKYVINDRPAVAPRSSDTPKAATGTGAATATGSAKPTSAAGSGSAPKAGAGRKQVVNLLPEQIPQVLEQSMTVPVVFEFYHRYAVRSCWVCCARELTRLGVVCVRVCV